MASSESTALPVAIVTGASRGIGRAIACRLAADKHFVIVNYVANRNAAEAVVDEIGQAGGQAIAVQGDVGETSDRQRLIDSALRHGGRLDVLVNNAGITSPGRKDVLEATEENWDRVMATNLKGPFFLAQAAANCMIQHMRADKTSAGTIINISSISAYAVSNNRPDYCIAKSAMRMVTLLFANRLAEEKIVVFEISPGVVASDMTAPVKEKYDRLIAEGLTPIRRWGQPDDVAKAVSALVSGTFPFCTGDRINIDGGFHIRQL